ncbi:MAG TPA: glutamate--tRNA ligase [Anaerolineae bacterium]|nr:glutamate--tRNA ligase [Anaerolineae bacterium]
MTQKPARVRYAPSPTGFLHVGGARTALFDYLLARQSGGSFILRIEDTDQKRYNPESVTDLLNGLRYLGLDWDEGPGVGGEYGPYTQTERLDLYQKYVQVLLAQGLAYRCFATPAELEEMNEARRLAGLSPGYDRRYRALDPAEAERRAAAGEPHAIRIKLPLDGSITVHDAIRGEITFDNKELQDAVLIKSDGIPTYHFAVVVDDHLMEITHVLRGEEWLSSYPLHAHLYHYFGWEMPIFAHLPVILNPSGKGKMSKRESRAPDGKIYPVFVHTFQQLGYLPEALFNYLALVGWSYDGQTEIMSRQELIERFSLARVNNSPASWDYEKLDHFNGLYIRSLDPADLTDRLMPFLTAAGLAADRPTMLKITPTIQERLTLLSDAAEWVDFFFVEALPDFDLDLLLPKKMTLADLPPILRAARDILAEVDDFSHDRLDAALRAGADQLGVKVGQLFQPIRVAVCGKLVAPPLLNTLEILGRDRVLSRLDRVLERLSNLRLQ